MVQTGACEEILHFHEHGLGKMAGVEPHLGRGGRRETLENHGRNKEVLGVDIYMESSIYPILMAIMKEIMYVEEQEVVGLKGVRRGEVWVGWKCPPAEWRQMNTDRTAGLNGVGAATGDLLRDAEGKWCEGFCGECWKRPCLNGGIVGCLDGALAGLEAGGL